MKKFLLLLVLCCFGAGICLDANAKRKPKQPKFISVYLEKKRTDKGARSMAQPINAMFAPDGNSVTLNSLENFDRAFITISGIGTHLIDMVNFTNQTTTLDVSDLDGGVYLITVEYENGDIYVGQFEFTE